MTQATLHHTTISRAVRRPTVAGYYYPADSGRLRGEIEALTGGRTERSPALAALVPHGSLRRSGAVTGATLARVTIPGRCVVIGPSHTGRSAGSSLMMDGAYRTPLGEVPIDEELAEALRSRCPFLSPDPWAQRGEHAVEVVLPFLQRLGPTDLTIAPILLETSDEEEILQLSAALIEVARAKEGLPLLIASSDLSQHEPRERGAAIDQRLIEQWCRRDARGLLRAVQEGPALMCGASAAACVLEAAVGLGADRATCEAYGTSAEAGGDPDSTTGYAGLLAR